MTNAEVRIAVSTDEKFRLVPAISKPLVGLAVTASIAGGKGYRITSIACGYALGRLYTSKAKATRALKHIAATWPQIEPFCVTIAEGAKMPTRATSPQWLRDLKDYVS